MIRAATLPLRGRQGVNVHVSDGAAGLVHEQSIDPLARSFLALHFARGAVATLKWFQNPDPSDDGIGLAATR